MFKWLYFLSISCLQLACSLNSEQERQLNKSLSNYLNTKKSLSVLDYIFDCNLNENKTSEI